MTIVESLEHLFLTFGAVWVLWLLIGLSVASLAVALDRWWALAREQQQGRRVADAVEQALQTGDVASLKAAAGERGTVAAAVATAVRFAREQRNPAATDAVDDTLRRARRRLEARLSFLATLGNNAPFLGLFGTVIGVIQAFAELGRGGGAAGATSEVVMAGIAEALVATAVGIAVALPAVAFYNLFQRKVGAIIVEAQAAANLVVVDAAGGDDDRDEALQTAFGVPEERPRPAAAGSV